ncbi:MAG: hypothetical protein HQ478_07470 [Chloroflexi bacterium]|nr:hypothetical protein [Chloroflexota bacterium]
MLERAVIILTIALFSVSIACISGSVEASPSIENSGPTVQQSEAITRIKTFLGEIESVSRSPENLGQPRVQEGDVSLIAPGQRSCLQDIEEQTQFWIGAYLGEGIWQVRAEFKQEWLGSKEWRWKYFSESSAVFTPNGQLC